MESNRFTKESKTLLAKLMATENLVVEHQKVATARFDVKNRVLTLPIWKDMSGDLYDLLVGHEVSHALYTPLDGLVSVLKGKSKNFKSFLNVVEDARVERNIQRKYPGLRKAFRNGYVELAENNFFGTKERDINSYYFIDKLNIFCKTGKSFDIDFTDEEMVFVDRIETVETWDEVVSLTEDIFEFSKLEQNDYSDGISIGEWDEYYDGDVDDDMSDDNFPQIDGDGFGENEQSGIESKKFEDESEESGDESKESGDESSESDDKSGNSEKSGEDSDKDEEEDKTKTYRYSNGAGEIDGDDIDPVCETDEFFSEQQYKLLDEKSKNYVYVDIPTMDVDELIIPHTVIHNYLSDQFSSTDKEFKVKMVKEFKAANEKYVSLLVKEFEMRKSAKLYGKCKVSETGDINVSKLFGYKFDDKIFKNVSIVPNGKSHGMVLLLDCSGSMNSSMEGAFDQILILSMFCKKINVPFDVYGFTDRNVDYSFWGFPSKGLDYYMSKNDGELYFCGQRFYLRHYLSSSMSASKYAIAMENLILLKASYSHRSYLEVPGNESLGGTPLTESILASYHIISKFKQRTKVDFVSLIIVHDGDTNSSINYIQNNRYVVNFKRENNYFLQDKKRKFQYKIDGNYCFANEIYKGLLVWLKESLNANVIGFYICNNIRYEMASKFFFKGSDVCLRDHPDYHYDCQLTKDLLKLYSKEKFICSYTPGYNKFFFINGGANLRSADFDLDVDDGADIKEIKKEFLKNQKRKVVSRVLVRNFIEELNVL